MKYRNENLDDMLKSNKLNSLYDFEIEKVIFYMIFMELAGLLLGLPYFAKFIRFISIEKECLFQVLIPLMQSLRFFNYIYVPKNSYIFKENDKSDKFYGIIKGLVSMRVSKSESRSNGISNYGQRYSRSYSSRIMINKENQSL